MYRKKQLEAKAQEHLSNDLRISLTRFCSSHVELCPQPPTIPSIVLLSLLLALPFPSLALLFLTRPWIPSYFLRLFYPPIYCPLLVPFPGQLSPCHFSCIKTRFTFFFCSHMRVLLHPLLVQPLPVPYSGVVIPDSGFIVRSRNKLSRRSYTDGSKVIQILRKLSESISSWEESVVMAKGVLAKGGIELWLPGSGKRTSRILSRKEGFGSHWMAIPSIRQPRCRGRPLTVCTGAL